MECSFNYKLIVIVSLFLLLLISYQFSPKSPGPEGLFVLTHTEEAHHWTVREIEQNPIKFLSSKEQQYRGRREHIKNYCALKERDFGRMIPGNNLIYDKSDGVSYCQIAKVGSSTWCSHFLRLGEASISETRDTLHINVCQISKHV